MATAFTVEHATQLLDQVVDPDLPFLTIADIGILRGVSVDESDVTVTITPTYSGCPAMDTIMEDIGNVLRDAGAGSVTVAIVHNPAWTTDWMTPAAREKLAANRIAPPGPVDVVEEVLCPVCSAGEPRQVSEFGSTACKALMVCTACGEPFDRFKAI